jgi:hypothetical protein
MQELKPRSRRLYMCGTQVRGADIGSNRQSVDPFHEGGQLNRAGSVNRKITDNVGYFYNRNQHRLYNNRK